MRKSFTLIELLIVVAVMAILAGLLLPALNRARERGMGVKCMANLKNVGMVMHAYTSQANDTFPFAEEGKRQWYTNPGGWILKDYFRMWAGDPSLPDWIEFVPLRTLCPKVANYGYDRAENYPGYSRWADWAKPSFYGMTGASWDIGKRILQKESWYLHKFNLVRTPSAKVMQAETNSQAGGANHGCWRLYEAVADATAVTGIVYAHNQMANVLFFDLHVEAKDHVTLRHAYEIGNNWKPYVR
mgnify:FL=1